MNCFRAFPFTRRRRQAQTQGLADEQAQPALPDPATLYQYSPLDEEAQEISVLRLIVGTRSSEIPVCLENTHLSENFVTNFEAFSYT